VVDGLVVERVVGWLVLSACRAGFFGVDCELVCNCQSTLERCHPVTGDCASHCRTGYAGPGCQLRKHLVSVSNCAVFSHLQFSRRYFLFLCELRVDAS